MILLASQILFAFSYCLKITENVAFELFIKWTNFGILNELLSTLKCKRSSLRSQGWMRLFLWFSNTVNFLPFSCSLYAFRPHRQARNRPGFLPIKIHCLPEMVICLLVSDSKLWEIIFEGNFSFCSQYMTRNWTFDKFNLRITSEASFKEG